jgi:hypothetical protein
VRENNLWKNVVPVTMENVRRYHVPGDRRVVIEGIADGIES